MSQYPGPSMSHPEEASGKSYGSSGSESKSTPSGSGKKRASRAGTRSVTTLSAVQLERKRANDRDAQRAIRQRTKDHIEGLEGRITELTATYEAQQRVIQATQQRNRELEEENNYLRHQVGAEGREPILVQITGAKDKSAESGSQSTVPAASPQGRLPVADTGRHGSQSTRGSVSTASQSSASQPDTWRQQHRPYNTAEPSTGLLPDQGRVVNLQNQTAWRGPHEIPSNLPVPAPSQQAPMDPPQRSYSNTGLQERPQWAGAAPSYTYMVDSAHQTPSYQGQPKQMPYQGQPQTAQYQSMQSGLPVPPPPQASYSAPVATAHAEFQGLSMQNPAPGATAPAQQLHEHQGAHSPYNVAASQMAPPGEYHGAPQHPGMQREHLTAPAYNAPPTSQAYPQPSIPPGQHMPIEYHAPTQQPHYYGSYHGNG